MTQVDRLIEQLTETIQVQTRIPFSRDPYLKEGLMIHVLTSFNRLRFGLPIANPLTKEIKRMYPFLFNLLIENIMTQEQVLGLRIPAEEAAYLTLHYQASYERIKKEEPTYYQVGVICHMGIGVSEILKAKLECSFPALTIKETLATHDLSGCEMLNNLDLIISTVALSIKHTPVIIVSPLFSKTDQEKVAKWVEKKETTEAINSSLVTALIKPDYIFMNQRFDHPYELIEYIGNRLVQAGVVDADYPHQALIRERKASTAIGGNISVPHGDPVLVHQSTVAIVTLKEPLNWDGESVSLVFFTALKQTERNYYKSLYQRLAVLSEQPSHVKKIISSKTKIELINNL